MNMYSRVSCTYEDDFEYECIDCKKVKKTQEDLFEFVDLAFLKLARGDTDREVILGLIDEAYCIMGYTLPKEIIENLTVRGPYELSIR